MIIREFKRSDIKRVLEIEITSFSDPYPTSILLDVYNLGAGFLVAQKDNLIVGYIIFWIRFEDDGHIISIAVDERYRRRGIGHTLTETAIQIFKKYKVRQVKLEVRAKNKVAIKFYKALGFEEKEILENYYDDGEDAMIMMKILSKT